MNQSPSHSIITELKDLYIVIQQVIYWNNKYFFLKKLERLVKDLSNIRLMDLTDLRELYVLKIVLKTGLKLILYEVIKKCAKKDYKRFKG